MSIEKKSGNRKIIDSGILITYEKEDDLMLDVKLGEDSEDQFEFSIKFAFTTDKNKKSEVERSVDTDNSIINITCMNFEDNILGAGIAKPINLATYEDGIIYLNFIGYSLFNNTMKKIEYCLYQEQPMKGE